MQTRVLRSPYNYDVTEASNEATIKDYGPSLTIQSHAKDADLNEILRRFNITGQMPENTRLPEYGDFLGIGSYQDAMNAVLVAQAGFMDLPADVRSRFQNNPQKLLEFVSDDANLPEAHKLGLLRGDSNYERRRKAEAEATARAEQEASRARVERDKRTARLAEVEGGAAPGST